MSVWKLIEILGAALMGLIGLCGALLFMAEQAEAFRRIVRTR